MSDSSFQKPGDVCESCKERWEKIGKPPKVLIGLPSYTMRYHSEIAICPYCDSDQIEKLAQASIKRRENATSKS
jgi:uncharacterized protein with PIN domain